MGVLAINEQHLHSIKAISVPHPTSEGIGVHKNWEVSQPGQVTPTDPRGIPDHMESCSAQEAGEKRREEDCLE